MNITSAQYINNYENADYVDPSISQQSIKATIDGVSTTVPLDPANRHYAEIMRQVEAGELTIQEAD
jgi:hypothetical protein